MLDTRSIIILGPAHPLRGGGITTYNQQLCKALISRGFYCKIVSFTLQYPNFLFPGKSQFTEEPAPIGIPIESLVNSVNPLNWLKVGRYLSKQNPDILIVRYWLPFMGPCLGTILRIVRLNKKTEIICIADNVIPHENRIGDAAFTKYFIKPVHRFVTMSNKVLQDLKSITTKPVIKLDLPLFDNFGKKIPKKEAIEHLELSHNKKIILFFGFVRKYKGLDLLIEAISFLKENNTPILNEIVVLIAGEFYEDEEKYKSMINQKELKDFFILKSDFIILFKLCGCFNSTLQKCYSKWCYPISI
jgi:glycosyltransferase involved in cell wall biosynthesis